METPGTYTVDKSTAVIPAGAAPSQSIEVGVGITLTHPLELTRQMQPFVENAADMAAQADRAVIETDEAYVKGTEFLSTCTQQWNAIEEIRTAAKKPVDDLGRFIQVQCKPAQDQLSCTNPPGAKQVLEAKMLAYRRVVAERQRLADEATKKKQEEEALALAQQEQDKGNTTTAAAILDAATTMPAARAAAPIGGARTNSMGRSTNVAKVWKGSAEKPMEVLQAIINGVYPISLIQFQEGEMNKAAKTVAATGTFHGLKIEQVESLRQH